MLSVICARRLRVSGSAVYACPIAGKDLRLQEEREISRAPGAGKKYGPMGAKKGAAAECIRRLPCSVNRGKNFNKSTAIAAGSPQDLPVSLRRAFESDPYAGLSRFSIPSRSSAGMALEKYQP